MISAILSNHWGKSYIDKVNPFMGMTLRNFVAYLCINKQQPIYLFMKKFKILALAVLLMSGSTFAQERPMHEVYSMMVFNFTRYVQWPDQATSGEFVIGVIGNNDVFKTLTEWYGGKPRGSKTYVIKKFNSAAEIADCHVLYIDKSKSGEFDVANSKVKGKGTLVITDKNGLGEKGSGINFKTVDSKLKFELNQKAIEASNLKVSGSLSSMAILI
jgi:hypothetical protein